MKPIFLRRSFRTASRLPELIGEGRDFVVPEGGHAMSGSSRLRMLMSVVRVLQSLPGVLVPAQVILLSMLLGDPMGMRRGVVQFGGALVILVMRSVVIAGGHDLEAHDLPGLGVGFLGKLVGTLGILQSSF